LLRPRTVSRSQARATEGGCRYHVQRRALPSHLREQTRATDLSKPRVIVAAGTERSAAPGRPPLAAFPLKPEAGCGERRGANDHEADGCHHPDHGYLRVRVAPVVQHCELRGAGPRQRTAKAKWCCSPVRQASASRDSRRLCLNVSPASRTHACVTSVRRSTPIVRFIGSSAR
jgi:hypothetical protein